MDIKTKQVSEYIWEIPKEGDMVVPGRIYADHEIMQHLIDDVKAGKDWNALKQIKNVACLPGIQKASLAMSDVHPGYGFCIGGVGAFDMETGVVSVAGVGFDINCGVRTLATTLTKADVEKNKQKIADAVFNTVPAGLGSTGDIRLSKEEIDEVLVKGAEFIIERGYGTKEDLKFIEEEGKVAGADPATVSDHAKKRQFKQIGTLGSGNHYLEFQYVDEVFDEKVAEVYGLKKDQVLISIHCGSRALGHQIGTDYLKKLDAASRKYNIPIRERELVCAPINSQEGKEYFAAVCAGINCAFANRQAITHLTRLALKKAIGLDESEVKTFYEIGHNTAKKEKHKIDGKMKEVLIHRKGSTRAFGPGREEIPEKYRSVGQPVLVGGTMGTMSYILHGTQKGMDDTFGSAIHGAGRLMSRHGAIAKWKGDDIVKDLARVVDVMHNSGIAKKVVMVKPLICIKG